MIHIDYRLQELKIKYTITIDWTTKNNAIAPLTRTMRYELYNFPTSVY